jgi:HTH-like domain
MHAKTYRYVTKRAADEELRGRLRELASQRRRFGYRRLGVMLKRQGIKVNAKKLYRLYREERLTVRKRGGRKRALGTRSPMAIPQDRHLRWSIDFVTDTLVSGRRFRILTMVDDSPENVLAWWSTLRSLAGVLPASSIGLPNCEANGKPCAVYLTGDIRMGWSGRFPYIAGA